MRTPAPFSHRLDDLASQPQHRGLIGRAMPHGQGPGALGQAVENPREGCAECRRVLIDQFAVGRAQCAESAAPSRLIGPAPAVLDCGSQARLDHHAAGHPLAECTGKQATVWVARCAPVETSSS
jgi:hypothetical protein